VGTRGGGGKRTCPRAAPALRHRSDVTTVAIAATAGGIATRARRGERRVVARHARAGAGAHAAHHLLSAGLPPLHTRIRH
jgi:hypothetical protein